MKNKSGDRFWLFLIPCWLFCVFFFLVFLKNSDWFPKTPTTIYDLTYLIASLVFLILPFVSRLRLGKLFDIERELGKTKEDMNNFKNETRQMLSLVSTVSANVSNITNIYLEEDEKKGKLKSSKTKAEIQERTPTEYKILNTLWIKQVAKYPDMDGFWSFRLSEGAPEFFAFREAALRLMIEGLIYKRENNQFALTSEGFSYCAEHYTKFPGDMWFKSEPQYQDNLDKVLKQLSD